ncbi:MAG: hypothetical protein ACI8XC_002697 [Gammaproteobacteria bacterium]|jgi:hypothetical protein
MKFYFKMNFLDFFTFFQIAIACEGEFESVVGFKPFSSIQCCCLGTLKGKRLIYYLPSIIHLQASLGLNCCSAMTHNWL